MVSVVEYGEHIGTLKNLFVDMNDAVNFAGRLMAASESDYEPFGPDQWYCHETGEYLKIEIA